MGSRSQIIFDFELMLMSLLFQIFIFLYFHRSCFGEITFFLQIRKRTGNYFKAMLPRFDYVAAYLFIFLTVRLEQPAASACRQQPLHHGKNSSVVYGLVSRLFCFRAPRILEFLSCALVSPCNTDWCISPYLRSILPSNPELNFL